MLHRALIVDDNDDIRFLLRANLEFAGYEVIESAAASEALELAHSERPDVIVLDVMLPIQDGFEILAELKENPATAAIPVVMLTARTSRRDTYTGLAGGAAAYLHKPFTPMKLIQTIELALGDDPQIQEHRRKRAMAELEKLGSNGS